MERPTRRRIVQAVIALAVVAGLIWAFLPARVAVRTVVVARGPLSVLVEEEGRTRVADRYVLTSPVVAFARRLPLEAGDHVSAGDPVIELEPPRSALLDPRTRAEATARIEAARAHAGTAEVAVEHARIERERFEALAAAGSATLQARDQARADHLRALANLEAARADVAAAEAVLRDAPSHAQLAVQEVLRSPIDGQVLAVHLESAGPVNPGEPLVEIGDIGGLEIVVDVLSQDAVRVGPGTRVQIDRWGGDEPLSAVVQRVEPQGFTAISSLGVEEQRVTVVARLRTPPDVWASRLGSGYRVLARFVVWEDRDVLQVPTSALFRTEEGWAVFVVSGRRAVRRPVTVGQQAGLAAEIVDGLVEGDEVIVHPDNQIEDGLRVDPERDEAPPARPVVVGRVL